MKTTISTLIAFSVLGLVAPPAGVLDSKASTNSVTVRATERPTEAPSLVRELFAARNCDRSQYLREWEAGIKAP
jgi:hypothetical protein